MGKAPKAPAPTDPLKSSAADQNAQTGTAIAQTWMNNAQEFSPFGSKTVERTGTQYTKDAQGKMIEIPTFTQTVTLSPAEQEKYDRENALARQMYNIGDRQLQEVSDRFSTPVSEEGLPGVDYGLIGKNYDGYREQALQKMRQFYSPELDRQQEANYTALKNRGINEGSEAYREAQALDARRRNDVDLQMFMQSGSEADRAAALDQSSFQNQSLARERALQERLTLRRAPLEEVLAFTNGGDVNVPQFSQFNAGTIRPTDVAGQFNHYDNMRMQQYQAQMQAYNARMAGMAQLGGAAMGLFRLSDVRFKSEFVELARDARGFGWYEYTIGGRREIGVIAQEVAPIVPDAVREFGGVLMVNYGALIDGR